MEQLISDTFQAGKYSVKWEASEYSSGVYFIKMIMKSQINFLIKSIPES